MPPWGCAGHVVGEDVLHVAFSFRTRHEHFAHVAHVEHAAGVAHSLVLVGDVGVLYRHFKTAERHHFGTEGNMAVVKTSSFFRHDIK